MHTRRWTLFLSVWLLVCCSLIAMIVAIGGVTRLTGSGLSMVDWHPIEGVRPPLSAQEWGQTFAKYQTSPQFEKMNHWMTVDHYKKIFFWEYIHRMLARFIGLVAVLPLVFIWRNKRLSIRQKCQYSGIGLLVGLQGLLGWAMVKSGLVDLPSVSHFRLAAHLILALTVYSYCFWLWLELKRPQSSQTYPLDRRIKWLFWMIVGLFFVQLNLGAWVAGLKGGYGFNTFPKMGQAWMPASLWTGPTPWKNALFHPMTVQFIHRTVAWLLGAASLFMAGLSLRIRMSKRQRYYIWIFCGLIVVQFLLGVMTLLSIVALPLAVLHQLGALMVTTSLVAMAHVFFRP